MMIPCPSLALCVRRPNYRKMYKDLSNQEGKFKKIHARVRICSESIGFFGGGDREKQMVNERFEKYMLQDWCVPCQTMEGDDPALVTFSCLVCSQGPELVQLQVPSEFVAPSISK